jgi:DNA mismatch repair protein MutS2
MTLTVGSRVIVIPLKQEGRIVRVLKNSSYRVAIGHLEVTCKRSEIEDHPLSGSENASIDSRIRPPQAVTVTRTDKVKVRDRIDLHGMRVTDALKLFEEFLDRAMLAGLNRVEVIHGLGSDRVRIALHQYLQSQPVVRSFRHSTINPGVTWVYLG